MPSLIEWPALKTALGIPAGDATQDTYLAGLAAAASEVIELYLRRHLESKSRTETIHQSGECLRLRGYPVAKVDSVKAGDDEIADYQLDAETGLLYRDGGWPMESTGYEVKYTGGLGPPYPSALAQAAMMLAMQMKASAEQGGMSAASERLGDYSITYMSPRGAAGTASGLDALNPAAAALLRVYMGGTM